MSADVDRREEDSSSRSLHQMQKKERDNMDTLLSGYYKGKKETGVFYRLFSAMMFDGTKVYGVIRDYGDHPDGN